MRISLILTALILLLAVGFGWDQERRIRQVRAASARLEPALTKRGIPADSDKRKGGKARDRGETSRDIRGLATALVEAFKLDPKIRWQYEENELSERIEDLDRAGFEERDRAGGGGSVYDERAHADFSLRLRQAGRVPE